MMMIDEQRAGRMIEFDQTNIIFTRSKDKRTEITLQAVLGKSSYSTDAEIRIASQERT